MHLDPVALFTGRLAATAARTKSSPRGRRKKIRQTRVLVASPAGSAYEDATKLIDRTRRPSRPGLLRRANFNKGASPNERQVSQFVCRRVCDGGGAVLGAHVRQMSAGTLGRYRSSRSRGTREFTLVLAQNRRARV